MEREGYREEEEEEGKYHGYQRGKKRIQARVKKEMEGGSERETYDKKKEGEDNRE